MRKTTGVAPLFREFKGHLKRNKKRLAPLQLVGRLEDYLTKEFACVIFTESGGSVLPIGNDGLAKDKRRIDLVLVKGDFSKVVNKETSKMYKNNLTIYAVIELKYVRNRHRASFADATDETSTAFTSLSNQVGIERRLLDGEFAGKNVRLLNRKHDTYGIVFASFVCRKEEECDEDQNKKKFIGDTLKSAQEHNFQSHNFKAPVLKEVYSKVRVEALNGVFLVSLYAGLWRIKEQHIAQELKAVAASLN